MKNFFWQTMVVMLIFSGSLYGKNPSGEYPYYSPPQIEVRDGKILAGDSDLLIVVPSKKIYLTSDFASGFDDCSAGDWKCMRAPMLFNFSFNFRWSEPPAEWVFGTARYQNLGEETISIFGKPIKTFLICTEGEKGIDFESTQDACFSFSKKYGVMAIYLYADGFSKAITSSYYASNGYGVFSSKSL